MCTISYISVAEAISDDIPNIGIRFHGPKKTIEKDNISRSSSFALSWLNPLPELVLDNGGSIPFPTFEDFEYIGRVGDGASAQVYCVQHIPSGQYVAIKVADGANDEARQQLEVEKQILFRYSHGNPYMVKPYCTFHCGVCIIVFFYLK
jgi:serine/threonine protein kinase